MKKKRKPSHKRVRFIQPPPQQKTKPVIFARILIACNATAFRPKSKVNPKMRALHPVVWVVLPVWIVSEVLAQMWSIAKIIWGYFLSQLVIW